MKKQLLLFLLLLPQLMQAQETFNLNSCLKYALKNNRNLQKDRLSLQAAALSRKEVAGAWFPQLSASGNFTRNLQKTSVAMPNFMKGFVPSSTDDYMVVRMGMDYAPNMGASLAQQVLNLSLVNATKIAGTAEQMARTGLALSTDDVISQTATLYFGIQVLEYAVSRFGDILSLMDKTLAVMGANRDAGLMREVDVKRITVSRTNLATESKSLSVAIDVQKRLLKLQMGFPVENDIVICPMDEKEIVSMIYSKDHPTFDVTVLPAFQMLKQQQTMLSYQYKSAVAANLPTLVLVGNWSYNFMWDRNKPESHNKFPMSMITLGLKMPIFTGGSNTARVKKARIEIDKSEKDEQALTQALSMSYLNARTQLDRQLSIVETQVENKELAKDVYTMTEANFAEGISSLTDVLNASSSLVQAEVNFSTALNNCITAYLDLKKADGTIQQLVK